MAERTDYGPSVADPGTPAGRLLYTSVSSITAFDPTQYAGCNRRWWFDKVAKKKEPETKAQATGVEIHGQNEHYLKTGENVLGKWARPGLAFMPTPSPDLLIEHEFGPVKGKPTELDAAGVPLVGYIDLVRPPSDWYVDESGEVANNGANGIDYAGLIPEVIDWKSTSNFKYAKNRAELVTTVQMNGYAEFARRKWSPSKVRVSHVYFLTKGKPEARKVTATIPVDTIHENWQRVGSVVEDMKRVVRLPVVEEVTPHYDSCSAYRGCPHMAYCPRSNEQMIFDIFGGNSMSLLDKIKGLTPASVTTTPAVPVATVVVTSPAPAAPITNATAPKTDYQIGFTEGMRCAECGAVVEHASDSGGVRKWYHNPSEIIPPCLKGDSMLRRGSLLLPDEKHRNDDGYVAPVATPAPVVTAAPVVPSAPPAATSPPLGALEALQARRAALLAEATALEAAEAAAKVPAGETPVQVTPNNAPVPGQSGPIADPIPEGTVVSPAIQAAAQVVAAEEAAAQKRRGRPPGSKNKPKEGEAPAPETPKPTPAPAQAPAEVEASAPEVVTSPVVETRVPASQPFSRGLHLFVDVAIGRLPGGPGVEDLDPWINAVCATLADQYKAADVRCAPNDSPLGFGKWKGAVAALVSAAPPEDGVYSVSNVAESEIRAVVVEALKGKCATFVRGVR